MNWWPSSIIGLTLPTRYRLRPHSRLARLLSLQRAIIVCSARMNTGNGDKEENTMKIPKVLLIGTAAILMTSACGAEPATDDRPSPRSESQAAPLMPHSPTFTPRPVSSSPQYPPSIAFARACGALVVLDQLSGTARAPRTQLGNPTPLTNGDELVKLATALQSVDRKGLPRPMDAAINAHATALSSLGELVRQRADSRTISSMSRVADSTGKTLTAFCES